MSSVKKQRKIFVVMSRAWLNGRASKHEIRSSEVRFLMETIVARRKTSFPTLLLNLGNFEKLACLAKLLSQNLKFAERNEV